MWKAVDIAIGAGDPGHLWIHCPQKARTGRTPGAMMRYFQKVGSQFIRIARCQVFLRRVFNISGEKVSPATPVQSADDGLIVFISTGESLIGVQDFEGNLAQVDGSGILDGDDLCTIQVQAGRDVLPGWAFDGSSADDQMSDLEVLRESSEAPGVIGMQVSKQ